MSLRVIWRVALVLLLDSLTLLALSALIDGFVLDGAGSALAAAATIGLLNALVWPALSRLALPLTVLTLGFAGLVLNGLLVTFAIDLLPNAEIGGVLQGVVVTIVMSGRHQRRLLAAGDRRRRRLVPERGEPPASPAAGLGRHRGSRCGVFLEIDGLAHDVLRRALADGSAPHLAAWLRAGSHRLQRWETDWSSQTGACQAGLLHGSNEDMPAFRWWEKDRGAAIVTNHPRDAEELERRHSDGRGLLHADGASRANILSGDARALDADDEHRAAPPPADRPRLRGLFRAPLRGRQDARPGPRRRGPRAPRRAGQVRHDVRPRIGRARAYALIRAWATVVQRDLQVAAVVGDILAGRPTIYTTFLAYDEVAHHSGIERHDSPRRAPRPRSPDRQDRPGLRRRPPALPARRALRPRPIAGRNLPRPLRRDP